VFKTLVARTFATKCWHSVRVGFYCDKVVREAWFILLFIRIGRHVRAGEMPTIEPFSATFFWQFNFFLSFFLISTELVTIIVLFAGRNLTPKGGLRRFFTGWTTGLVAAELMAMFAVFRWFHELHFNPEGLTGEACRDDAVHKCCMDTNCWYYNHAALLMLIVFVKCNQLLVNLMAYRPIGEQVYLAFATLLHPSSLWFSSFLIACGFSCVAAYYMIPISLDDLDYTEEHIIKEFSGTSWNDILYAESGFMKGAMMVFRMSIMGDFDAAELEGVNGVIKKWTGNQTWAAENDVLYEADDGEVSYFHSGIQMFTIVVCVCFNVLLLNVYIGLLGSVYGQLEARRAEVFVEFRATFTVRMLLIRTAETWFWSKLRCCALASEDDDARFKQHFIMYDTRVDKDIEALDLTHMGDDDEGGYGLAD